MTLIIGTFEGTGYFPIDMLRYDNCFPADSESANEISSSYLDNDIIKLRKIRIGKYVSNKKEKETAFTKRRWESFGYRLINVEVK